MNSPHLSRLTPFLFTAFLLLPATLQAHQTNKKSAAPTANKPESLGFSSDRLERLHTAMQQEVDQHRLPGLVTILARHGKLVEERTYGMKDIATTAPMTSDTIFRIYSMTKPVTGVAMMILYEQGKWRPSDPISLYIPEFSHLKVFKGLDQSGNMILEDPVHPPTMSELMTHTAGFTYGFFGKTPVDKMYDVHGPAGPAIPIPPRHDRQTRQDPFALPAGYSLGLQRLHGYSGLHH
jgi:CubicO group peptidase (beta-lactamase class C family)